MFSKWYGILWKSRSLEFYQINEMFNESARDSSTRIQRQIYPVSRATTMHSISAHRIFLFSFSFFFLKRTSHKSGFRHWWSTVKLCWRAWRLNGANPALQQYWGAPPCFLGTHLRSVLEFSPMSGVILFSSGGLGLEIVVSPCSLLNAEFSSSYLPYALKHRQSQAFSDLSRSRG